MNTQPDTPEKIRVSVGSAIVLGLLKGKLDAPPTTIYMLTHREGKCLANCGFCPQARCTKRAWNSEETQLKRARRKKEREKKQQSENEVGNSKDNRPTPKPRRRFKPSRKCAATTEAFVWAF